MKNHSHSILTNIHGTLLRMLTLLWLTFHIVPPLYAQDNTTHIELHGESVSKFFKDSRELMWIGTSNGLLCYDGQLQVRFNTEDCRRPHNFVSDICELDDGRIIVGMKNGLYVVDFPSRTCRRLNEQLSDIVALEKVKSSNDNSTQIFVGCHQGIAVLDGKTLEQRDLIHINTSNVTSSDNQIAGLSYDGKGTVWGCNYHRSIVAYHLKNRSMQRYTVSDSILSSPVNNLQVAGKRLYISTNNNGLLIFDTTTHHVVRDNDFPSSIKDLSLTDGRLYVCTDGGGVYRIDKDKAERLSSLSNSVYSCYYDKRSATLWCGYYQQGFSYQSQKPSPFSIYRYKDFSTEGLFVRSFARHDGQTVIGTRNGIYFIDETVDFVRHFTPEEIQGAIIMDIKFFAGKYIVANYEHGLFYINPKTLQLKPLELDKRYRESSCSRLAVTEDGKHLYAASSAGLIVLDENLHVVEAYDDRHSDILSTYIYDIMFDRTGKLWVSTSKGICLFNPLTKRFQSKDFPKGYFNEVPNITLSLTQDGNILAASEQTLYYSSADLSHAKEYPLHERLGLGYISFIRQIDIAGTPYQLVGTDCGLFLFDMNFERFHQYARQEDMPSPQFQRFNAYEDEQGTLWMANAKGLILCTKEHRKELTAKLASKVFIDRYTVDRKEHLTNPFSNENNTIRIGWNFSTDEIVIMPGLLDYSMHQNQRYYEWAVDSGEKELCYEGNPIAIQDLSLGTHFIHIALAGHPETAMKVKVIVTPSILFYAMTFGLISLIIMIVMMMQIRKRRKQLTEALKQKHQIELELVSSHAVRQHIQQQEEQQAKRKEERKQEKAEQLKYKSSEYKELKAKVKHLMEKERLYTNKDLRLSEVASKIGTNAGTLSLMFNDYMQTNYFDFINSYRVEHFKKLALDPEYSQYTVLGLSDLCGFKRSSFFSVFKKFEGCTPNEWVKKQKGN